MREQLKTSACRRTSPQRLVWNPFWPHTSKEAQLHMMMEQPAVWKVINPAVKGPGRPGLPDCSRTQRDDADGAGRLAAPARHFIDHHLWVTPQRDTRRRWAGRLSDAEQGRGWPRRLDARNPPSRTPTLWSGTRWEYHSPPGRLAGHAHCLARFRAASVSILRAQPGARSSKVNRIAIRYLVFTMNVTWR